MKPYVPLPPGHVDPLTTTWSEGHRLYRAHPADYAPNEFHPGTGDRLRQDDFAVIGAPERLDQGQGYRRVQEAASAAGITVVEG